MPIINIVHDMAEISPPETHEVDAGVLLADWLIMHYGADGFTVPTRIFRGCIREETEILAEDFEAMNSPISEDIYIIHSPLGGIGEIIYYVVVAILIIVAITQTVPDIQTPVSNQRQIRKSPNNDVTGQGNIARTLDRVPDIFGEVISYPDLILPTVEEFIGNIKFLTEYVCISRGFLEVSEVKSGNTLIDVLVGSSFEIFEPNETPPVILRTDTSNEVKGQELPAPNDVFVEFTADWGGWYTENQNDNDPSDNGVDFNGSGWISTISGAGESFQLFSTNDNFYLIDCWADQTTNMDGQYKIFKTSQIDVGIFLLDGIIFGGADNFNPVYEVNPNWLPYEGNFLDAFVFQFTIGGQPVTPKISKTPTGTGVIGSFVVADDEIDEIWIDIEAPRGLAQGDGLRNKVSVDLSFFIEEIDEFDVPTGFNFTHPINVNDNSPDRLFWTFKITENNSALVTNRRYRINGERLTDTDFNEANYSDRVEWKRLAGIKNISEPDVTGTTRMLINTEATDQVAALQQRKYNMRVIRKTVTWDGFNVIGDIVTGVGLQASRRFADAFLHYSLDPKLAERTVSQIDVEAIFSIQNELDAVFDGELGEFSATFDGKQTPAIEELRQIAQAVRCFITREGSFISVIRDQLQPVARGLFNRRNKEAASEKRTIKFDKPQDSDGIKLEYIDRLTNDPFTIVLPDDLPVGDPNFGLPVTKNPVSVSATGIKNRQQAWNRAQYELNKLIYKRISMIASVTPEAILLPLNSKVLLSNSTKISSTGSNGEVLAIDGGIIKTSERCVFDELKTYSVVFRNEEGAPALSVAVLPIVGDEFGFILDEPEPFVLWIRGFNGYQKGTLYIFDEDGAEETGEFLVQQKSPDDNGLVKLELINYSEQYYAADDQTAPPI